VRKVEWSRANLVPQDPRGRGSSEGLGQSGGEGARVVCPLKERKRIVWESADRTPAHREYTGPRRTGVVLAEFGESDSDAYDGRRHNTFCILRDSR
jgi:hypothetical protein